MLKLEMLFYWVNIIHHSFELQYLCLSDQVAFVSLCPPLAFCNPVVIQFHGRGRLSTLPAVTLTGEGKPTLPLKDIKSSRGRIVCQRCHKFILNIMVMVMKFSLFCVSSSGLWRFLPVKREQHGVCIPGAHFQTLSEGKRGCVAHKCH